MDKDAFTSARLYRPFREGEITIRVQFMLYILIITHETERQTLFLHGIWQKGDVGATILGLKGVLN
ncbi:hypothetical protein GCM10007362_05850 [Saccharibacillus endophyticus]|uniref:Uncharacterized protein n=1 Tax=Saccharibacillus endophyticus TaxID=2060666 RepID=A0ABQ1ZNJ1_9BACL|nr:hypothetical protein GCM10007362_05850 [Saccharibacillus endophyticus]